MKDCLPLLRHGAVVIVVVLVMLWSSQVSLLSAQTSMTAHFINVGQGASTLLEFSCGAVLIDAGGQDEDSTSALISYLGNVLGQKPLDAIFITHNHIDHTLSLKEVVSRFTVKRYIDNGQLTGKGTEDPRWVRDNAHTGGREIKVLEIEDSKITALSHKNGLTNGDIDPVNCPDADPEIVVLSGRVADNPEWPVDDFRDKNNHSLVIRVDYGEASFLFTGDLEEPAIETLLGYYDGTAMLDVDVYLVGHHGSYNGTTLNLIDAMTPEIAVFPVGQWDFGKDSSSRFTTHAYGHPRWVVVEALQDAIHRSRSGAIKPMIADGARRFSKHRVSRALFATAWDGNVKVKATTDGKFFVTRNN